MLLSSLTAQFLTGLRRSTRGHDRRAPGDEELCLNRPHALQAPPHCPLPKDQRQHFRRTAPLPHVISAEIRVHAPGFERLGSSACTGKKSPMPADLCQAQQHLPTLAVCEGEAGRGVPGQRQPEQALPAGLQLPPHPAVRACNRFKFSPCWPLAIIHVLNTFLSMSGWPSRAPRQVAHVPEQGRGVACGRTLPPAAASCGPAG